MSDAHLRLILSKYPARTHAVTIANQMRADIASTFYNARSVSYSGSYAKGTAIHTPNRGSDIDIFISTSTTMTLKDLYDYTYNFAQTRGWNPKRQNVSIGTQINGYEIDLVPGRVQDNSVNYHSLYVRRQDTWRQTNIALHISTVSQSHRLEEIKLYKLWRNLHNLDFTSFYMELFALEALKYRNYGALNDNFMHLLTYTRDNLSSARIVDPSNTNNIISDNMSIAEKRIIIFKASESASKPYWSDIVW